MSKPIVPVSESPSTVFSNAVKRVSKPCGIIWSTDVVVNFPSSPIVTRPGCVSAVIPSNLVFVTLPSPIVDDVAVNVTSPVTANGTYVVAASADFR